MASGGRRTWAVVDSREHDDGGSGREDSGQREEDRDAPRAEPGKTPTSVPRSEPRAAIIRFVGTAPLRTRSRGGSGRPSESRGPWERLKEATPEQEVRARWSSRHRAGAPRPAEPPIA